MARPQVADGEDGVQIWRIAVNIRNNQSRDSRQGVVPSLGVTELTTLYSKKHTLQNVTNCLAVVNSERLEVRRRSKKIFNNSVRTAKKTQHFTITKINWLTLFKEIIAVYSENRTKPMNTLCGQMQSY
jgi:hypothetical protein